MGVLGALVGSFLNVVIFRLPRGLSVYSPAWSFCPNCEKRLLPWHNVPIFAWLLLRGRCHFCAKPIAIVYPVVECVTALVFMTTWDACFVGAAAGMNSTHWAFAASLIVMYAGLIATAGMDIESYSLDIRVPLFTLTASVLFRGIQGMAEPLQAGSTGLPPGITCAALAAGAGWLLGWPLTRRLSSYSSDKESEALVEDGKLTAAEASGDPSHSDSLSNDPDQIEQPLAGAIALPSESAPAFQPLPIILLTLALIVFLTWSLAAPQWPAHLAVFTAGQLRGLVSVSIFLVVMILASMISREADSEMATTLEREQVSARSVAWRELVCLIPALAVGIVVFFVLRQRGWLGLEWTALIRQSIGVEHDLSGATAWLTGAAQGASDALIAAGLGWAVRIGGTLAFGKEAFGTGDIYLLAAIAAAGGWFMMLIAFFASALLALVGVVATSMHKTSRAIPFGPWLGLGALAALYLERPLAIWFGPAGGMIWSWLTGLNRLGAQ